MPEILILPRRSCAPRRCRGAGVGRWGWFIQWTMFLVVGVLAGPASAAATQPGEPRIQWNAAPDAECDEGERLRARVEELAGPGSSEVDATVTVARADTTLHATVEVRDASGSHVRHLESAQCEVVVEATALIVAVTTEPVAVATRLLPREGVPPPHVESPSLPSLPLVGPQPRHEVASRPPPSLADDDSPHIVADSLGAPFGAVDIRPQLGGGMVPGVTGGVGGGLSLGRQRLHGRLGAAYWGPGRASLDTTADPAIDVGVRIDAWTVETQVCGGAGRRPWWIGACAGGEFGALRGRGDGRSLAISRSRRRPWVALDATLNGRVQLHPRLSLGVWLAGAVPLLRAQFILSDGTVLNPPPTIAGRAGLEFAVRFW